MSSLSHKSRAKSHIAVQVRVGSWVRLLPPHPESSPELDVSTARLPDEPSIKDAQRMLHELNCMTSLSSARSSCTSS